MQTCLLGTTDSKHTLKRWQWALVGTGCLGVICAGVGIAVFVRRRQKKASGPDENSRLINESPPAS